MKVKLSDRKVILLIVLSLMIAASSGCASTTRESVSRTIESDELQAIVEESSGLTSLIRAGDTITIFTKEKITISSREAEWMRLVVLDTTPSRIRGRVVRVCCDQYEQGVEDFTGDYEQGVEDFTGDYEQDVEDVTGDYEQDVEDVTGDYEQEVEDVTGNDVEVKLEIVDSITVWKTTTTQRLTKSGKSGLINALGEIAFYAILFALI